MIAAEPAFAPRDPPSAPRAARGSAVAESSVATSLPARSTAIRSDTRSTSVSLWLMKMIDKPFGHQARERREQRGRLLRRQHRRRLVEDQDPRVAIKRLQDLDALALADGQRADARVRIDAQSELLAGRDEPRASARRDRREPTTAARVPSTMLSCTDRLSASVKCW